MRKLIALLTVLVSGGALAADPAPKQLPADIVAEVKASHDEKAPKSFRTHSARECLFLLNWK